MENTPIIEILRTVEYSVDFGSVYDYPGDDIDEQRTNFWRDVITLKSADTGFGHLVDSILEEGFHGSAVGWDTDCHEITEGHHRLVAAILLCMDTVLTSAFGQSGSHPAREGMYGTHFSAHFGCGIDTSINVEF